MTASNQPTGQHDDPDDQSAVTAHAINGGGPSPTHVPFSGRDEAAASTRSNSVSSTAAASGASSVLSVPYEDTKQTGGS